MQPGCSSFKETLTDHCGKTEPYPLALTWSPSDTHKATQQTQIYICMQRQYLCMHPHNKHSPLLPQRRNRNHVTRLCKHRLKDPFCPHFTQSQNLTIPHCDTKATSKQHRSNQHTT